MTLRYHKVVHPRHSIDVLARVNKHGDPTGYAWWCNVCFDRSPYSYTERNAHREGSYHYREHHETRKWDW